MSQQELLRKLEQRLTSEYKDTEAVIRAKIAYFTEDFDKDNKLHQKMVKDGVMSRQEYKRWYKDQMFTQKWANKMTTVISEDLTNANVTASKIINNNASAMFIDGATEAVKELQDYDPFEVFDTRQIKSIADENAKHLPESRVKIPKDQKWNEKRIKSSLMQSAVKGESAQQLAGRLLTVVGMNRKSAIRNARTMMTGSHNMGKLELGNEALEMGLDVRKKWIATFDSRTRNSHASLHGEVVDMDEEFSNGLMFPADPEGDPAEVYNCRCTMVITHDPKRGGMSKEEFKENVEENEAEKEAFKQANKDLKNGTSAKPQAEIQIPNDVKSKISSFEDKYYNAKSEHYWAVDKDGKVLFESDTRGKRNVSVPSNIDEYNTYGYSIHNHPAEAVFSSADIKNYEKYGLHGFVVDNTGTEYMLYNLNPVPKYKELRNIATDEEYRKIMPFSSAVSDAFDEIEDRLLAERRAYGKQLMEIYPTSAERAKAMDEWIKNNRINDWQIKWLEDNAEDYGFVFRKRKIKTK